MVVCLPITGMCYAILGALKLPLTERLRMNEAKVGGLVSSFGIMVGPIILTAGFLTDALGRKGVWIAGAALVALSLMILSRTQRYAVAVLAVAMLSAGWAAMINVANVLMYLAFDNVFMATNLLDFFFGLGAFLTPAAVVLLLRKLGYTTAVSFLGGLALIPIVFSLFIGMQADTAGQPATFQSLIGDPVMWLCALTLMVWAPLESCTAAWTTTFVADQAPPDEPEAKAKRIAAWTLSGFWLGFMGSRLLTALVFHSGTEMPEDPAAKAEFIAHTMDQARVTHIVLAVCALLAMTGLVFSRKRVVTIALILFAGLIMGPFFPNLMAVLLSHFSPGLHGRAVGILFGGASIGWTVIPLIIGAVAKRSNLHRGFVVAAIDAAILLSLVVVHLFYARGAID